MGRLILNEIEYSGTDGGVELTYAEYLALPEPAKHNGTTYYITDVDDDDNGFQPVIYSEDEREIGVSDDGKPLYQKTIYKSSLTKQTISGADYWDVFDSTDLTGIDRVWFVSGSVHETTDNRNYQILA